MTIAFGLSDKGRVRKINEDAFVCAEDLHLYVVADGMGGHAAGEVASRLAIEAIVGFVRRTVEGAEFSWPYGIDPNLSFDGNRLRTAIHLANRRVFRAAEEHDDYMGMGTTVVAALLAGSKLVVGHVGDSRLYVMANGELQQHTKDDSWAATILADQVGADRAALASHPMRNVLTNVLGARDHVDVHLTECPVTNGDIILLCTDGLHGVVDADTLKSVLEKTPDVDQAARTLITTALDAGGRDNVTVVYAEMPLFAERVRHTGIATTTIIDPLDTERLDTAPELLVPPSSSRANPVARAFRAIVGSRATWFAAGILIGVIGALGLTAYVAATQVRGSRTLVVAADGRAPFATIGDAIAAARTGDVVRVEPGLYREQVAIADGIDLVARVPGTVTIVHDGMSPGPALAIAGGFNVRVSGIRIDAQRALDVGVRVGAPAATLEMIELAGPIRQAIELSAGSTLTVRGSRIAVERAIVAVPDEGHAAFVNSVLTRLGPAAGAAVSLSPNAHLVLRGNAFAGFGADIVDGVTAARRLELLAGNLVAGSSR